MKVQIVWYGILNFIIMDLFNSREFREFVEKYEFKYRILFYYFQLNVKSENVVKIVKILVCK